MKNLIRSLLGILSLAIIFSGLANGAEAKAIHEGCEKASIGNEIWYDLNRNGKKDANERGISNVTLKLFHGDNIEKETTSKNGRYTFEDLCGGNYTVVVDAKDLPAGCFQVSDPDGKKDNTYKFGIANKQNFTRADFGYFCPTKSKIPATGPGALLMLFPAGLAGMVIFLLKKRASLSAAFKKLRRA